AMLRLAGEVCDGVRLHPFSTRRYLDEVVVPEIRTGMARGGRAREHFEISGGGFVATGPDEASVAEMLQWVRYRVALFRSHPPHAPAPRAAPRRPRPEGPGPQTHPHAQARTGGPDGRREVPRDQEKAFPIVPPPAIVATHTAEAGCSKHPVTPRPDLCEACRA